jgi:tRNA-dihydrouridine synthase 1
MSRLFLIAKLAAVSSLSSSLTVPVSTKIRLCTPPELTPKFATRLQHAGSAFITLHARYPSTRRRRHGPAELEHVKILKECPDITIPVVSNGNVRTWEDIERNLEHTGADGVMIGEAFMANPRQVDAF